MNKKINDDVYDDQRTEETRDAQMMFLSYSAAVR